VITLLPASEVVPATRMAFTGASASRPHFLRGDRAPALKEGRPESPGSRISVHPGLPDARDGGSCAVRRARPRPFAGAADEDRSPVTVAGPRRIHTGFLHCRP
jgi:hypothetical protein